MSELRTDLDLENGTRVRLYPNASNPLHTKPVIATYQSGYFYCDGTPPTEGPDYYFRDVFQYNDGFTVEDSTP